MFIKDQNEKRESQHYPSVSNGFVRQGGNNQKKKVKDQLLRLIDELN